VLAIALLQACPLDDAHTREERIARLEEYLKALQTEAKAVEEHIAEIKKVKQQKKEG
jgi:hypothetical protein